MSFLPSFLTGMVAALVLLVALIGLAGCGTKAPMLTAPTPAYLDALDGTAAKAVAPPPEAIEGLRDLFAHYTVEGLTERTPQVYAEDVYFRDGFREIRGNDALVEYFRHSASGLRSSRFEFEEPIRSGNDVYLRWIMHLNLARDAEDRWSRTLGMTHLRFNEEGKIIFHQDYWDPTDMLYYRIPVANTLIHQVRKKL